MTSLFLKVEVLAGSSEEATAADLARLAERLRIMVEADHNGVTMRAIPGQMPQDVLLTFQRERRLADYPQD